MITLTKPYAALIFDFDGTLVDSVPAHLETWQETFAAYGLEIEREAIRPYVGMSPWEICAAIATEYNLDIDVDRITNEKADRFLENLDRVTLIDPVLAIVRRHYRKLPMAVATGNLYFVAEMTMRKKNIFHYFDVIVSSKEMEHGKPAPDVFLEAARRIGISPEKCCAFEDTEVGMLSAQNAGMDVVCVQDLIAEGS
ncbi:MAG: HAD family phosphatase [Anaerolineales bacterium]|nr:HAD family phosphatase [Anaerolineales bacterium]